MSALGGDVNVTSPEFQRAERAIRDLDGVKQSIALTESEENYVLSTLAGMEGPLRRESFMQDPEVLENLRSLGQTSATPVGNMNLGQWMSRDEYIAQWEQGRTLAAAGDVDIPSPRVGSSTRAWSRSWSGP